MKLFFTLSVILQFLVEILVGLMMVTSPQSMVPEAAITEIFQLRNQGFIAISVGVATLMLWLQRKNPGVIAFASGFFVIYHLLVTMSGAINSTMGFEFAPMLLHVVLGMIFLVVWLGRGRLAF